MIDPMGSSYPIANANIHEVAPADISGGTDNQRVLPRQLSTGSLRGTQNVGYGNVKIDGSNDQIVFGSDQFSNGETLTIGSVNQIGGISSSLKSLGMKIDDSDGFTLFEMNGQTWFWYDKTTGKNVMQVGKLPDGSYGWAVATTGNNVADNFA